MLFVCIFVLIGLFIVCLSYFALTEPVMTILTAFETAGTPSWLIDALQLSYHLAFIILAVGVVLFGFLWSVKKEPDSYQM